MTKVHYDSYTRELGEALKALFEKLDQVLVEDDHLYAGAEFSNLMKLFEQRLNMTNVLDHIYEVHDGEGNIVDVLRFDTEEEAARFEKGITGDYYVRHHTLPLEELLELVLDLRMMDLIDEDYKYDRVRKRLNGYRES